MASQNQSSKFQIWFAPPSLREPTISHKAISYLPPSPKPAILNRAHQAQNKKSNKEVADMSAKYIFVTGGVVSSLGKGLPAASIGCLLEARGLKDNPMKFDPYLNVDPATMSPFQHGAGFTTDHGPPTHLRAAH